MTAGQFAGRVGVVFVLAGVGQAVQPVPSGAQVFHRPRCESTECADSVFQTEIERMVMTEGPLAADRDEDDLQELRTIIRRRLEAAPDDARLWLALSEAEYGLGDGMAALTAAGRALEAGADTGLVLRAQGAARMRVAGGELEGATLYFEALGHMTRETKPRFLADIAPMLLATELDWWQSADIDRLRSWMRDYWEHRAALAGVTPEERLSEHMRRVATASQLYAPTGTGSGAPGYADVLQASSLRMLPYDDRGIVYIRRGPPHRELRVPSDVFAELPSTTWLYAGVEGSVDAFHFGQGLSSGSGYRLVVPPACSTAYVGSGLGSELLPVSDGWVLETAGASADDSRALLSCFGGDYRSARANAALNRIELRRQAMRALAAESPRSPFLTALPAFFDHYMFRGPDGQTEVVTPVVVPVDENERLLLELMVTFADRGGGVVRREATASSARAQVVQSILSGGEGWGVAYVRTLVQPADDAAFRLVVRDGNEPQRGGMWGGDVRVRSYAGPGPHMSDLLVTGSGPSTWERGGTRLFLLPARSFTPGASAAIFYELYDMRPGTQYRTELTLRTEDEGLGDRILRALLGRGEVRIRFEGTVPEGAGPVLQELRTLRLPDDEGRYALTIRVTDEFGRAAESTRAIVVSEDAAAPSGSSAGGILPALEEDEEE